MVTLQVLDLGQRNNNSSKTEKNISNGSVNRTSFNSRSQKNVQSVFGSWKVLDLMEKFVRNEKKKFINAKKRFQRFCKLKFD